MFNAKTNKKRECLLGACITGWWWGETLLFSPGFLFSNQANPPLDEEDDTHFDFCSAFYVLIESLNSCVALPPAANHSRVWVSRRGTRGTVSSSLTEHRLPLQWKGL